MKKVRAIFVALTLAILAAVVTWQQQTISRLRSELATSQAALEQEKSRVELQPANAIETDNELEKLRREHAELLRLRGEMTRLQKTPKAGSTNNPSRALAKSPVDVSQNNELVATGITTVTLKNNETIVTGGWDFPAGKKTFLFVTPEFHGTNEITLAPRFIEVPDAHVAAITGEIASGRFSAADYKTLLKRLESIDDLDILTAPKARTGNGQQVQISSLDRDGNGTLDCIPSIAADGSSVSLTIVVQNQSPPIK